MNFYKINEIYQHQYYKIPKELFTNEKYKILTSDAKIIYTMLLDRMELSAKNNWYDENGDIYLIFTRKSIQDLLGISDKPVTKAFKQLSDLGLIKEKRQGLTKPNIIYIGKIEHETIDKIKNRKMSDSGFGKYPIQESANVRTNNTYISYTDLNNNNTEPKNVVVENNTVIESFNNTETELLNNTSEFDKPTNDNNKVTDDLIEQVKTFIAEPLINRDIKTLLQVANGDINTIQTKYNMVKQSKTKVNNLVGFLIYAITKDYQVTTVENKCNTNNKFNNFTEQHNYDWEEIERLEFECMIN